MSDVEGVVLAVGQSLPAGWTGVWWCQSVSQTLAAEYVTTFSGNNQSAALYDLWWKEQPTNQNTGFYLPSRCATGVSESHLRVRVQTYGTADRPRSQPVTETVLIGSVYSLELLTYTLLIESVYSRDNSTEVNCLFTLLIGSNQILFV